MTPYMEYEFKNKVYVVRVTMFGAQNRNPSILECFRYAGLIKMHVDDVIKTVFDIYPPRYLPSRQNTKQWATANAKRIHTFGYNAEVVPEFEEYKEVKEETE